MTSAIYEGDSNKKGEDLVSLRLPLTIGGNHYETENDNGKDNNRQCHNSPPVIKNFFILTRVKEKMNSLREREGYTKRKQKRRN